MYTKFKMGENKLLAINMRSKSGG